MPYRPAAFEDGTRGLKLFAIILALNFPRVQVDPFLGMDSVAQKLIEPKNLFTVFVSGNLPVSGSKLVSFSILVPISYLLMLSGALMISYRIYRYTFHLVCALLLLSILILGITGARSYDLEFVTMGMLGVLAGLVWRGCLEGKGEAVYLLPGISLRIVLPITRGGLARDVLRHVTGMSTFRSWRSERRSA